MKTSDLSLNFPKHGRYRYLSHRYGGMGVVVFALDTETERQLVLKTIKPELLLNQSTRLAFLQEAVNWLFLGSHPNLIQAKAVTMYAQPELPWLVLEGVSGNHFGDDVSLAGILAQLPQRQLPLKSAIKITLDIAHGMHYARTRIPNLVHRDIKPENVLLNEQGRAKITDFGIATTLEQSEAFQAQVNNLIKGGNKFLLYPAGSPNYVPAEMFLQQDRVATISCDVYALGMVLYEMLVGHKRVQGKTYELIRAAQIDRDFLAIPAAMPVDLRSFIERCADSDPEVRYQTWPEVIEQLQAAYRFVAGTNYIAAEQQQALSQEELVLNYISVAQAYLDLDEPETALTYIDHVVKQIADKQSSDRELLSQAQLIKASALQQQNKYQQAEEIAKALLVTAPSNIACKAALLLAHRYGETGNYAAAQHCLASAEKLASVEELPLVNANQAQLLAREGNHQAAMVGFTSLLEHFTELNDWNGMCQCLHSMGLSLAKQNQWQDALDHFDSAIELAERLFDATLLIELCKYAVEASLQLSNSSTAQCYVEKIRNVPGLVLDEATQSWLQELDL